MSTDPDAGVLSHFGGLDDLIQVIYQGADRLVAISKVTESAWSIYLGIEGPEGTWWRGSWSGQHIIKITGVQSPSSQMLESFAENLRTTFITGDLEIGQWIGNGKDKDKEDLDINLTFGRTVKHPLRMTLKELSATEAASHATAVFIQIALQAQTRKCQLNPVALSSGDIIFEMGGTSGSGSSKFLPTKRSRKDPTCAEPNIGPAINKDAERKIKVLETELARAKQRLSPRERDRDETPKPSSTRPPKGASLANPNKKARKYQALEFESDEE